MYFFLELTFDLYLQYNFLFVLDSLFVLILNSYGRFFGYIFFIRKIENFINYPLILLFIGLILVFFNNKYRYIYFDYIKIYYLVLDENLKKLSN